MEALAETHLGRDGGDLRPTTSPSSPGGEQHIHSGDRDAKAGRGSDVPPPQGRWLLGTYLETGAARRRLRDLA